VDRYFYSSNACVCNQELQDTADVEPLPEGDAYPSRKHSGYGWEKPRKRSGGCALGAKQPSSLWGALNSVKLFADFHAGGSRFC
jgi:hypothetical protein